MAKRKTIEKSDSDAVANPEDPTEQAKPTTELPFSESPPVSPENPDDAKTDIVEMATKTPSTDVEGSSTPKPIMLTANRSRFIIRPRHKRHALFAASVAIAAAFGAIVGAAATGSFSKPNIDLAVDENRATQQSLARLAKEVAGLKTSLDAVSKSAHSQITKLTERFNRDSTENTGSIAPTQSVPAAPPLAGPLPIPRPTAAATEAPPPRLSIVPDWSIRETRDGYLYVQGHGGDVYQVVRGAALPGLGPVEQIKRLDGRWMVVTPKGIIVSTRDRRYFQQF